MLLDELSQISAMLADKLKNSWLVLEGSAGEAACRGREIVGVLKIEEHSVSVLARRTEGSGGSTSQATTGRACRALYIRNCRKECKIQGFRESHTLDGAKGRQK